MLYDVPLWFAIVVCIILADHIEVVVVEDWLGVKLTGDALGVGWAPRQVIARNHAGADRQRKNDQTNAQFFQVVPPPLLFACGLPQGRHFESTQIGPRLRPFPVKASTALLRVHHRNCGVDIHRNKARHARFVHGDSYHLLANFHRHFIVRNDQHLHLLGHFLDHGAEATHVGII